MNTLNLELANAGMSEEIPETEEGKEEEIEEMDIHKEKQIVPMELSMEIKEEEVTQAEKEIKVKCELGHVHHTKKNVMFPD